MILSVRFPCLQIYPPGQGNEWKKKTVRVRGEGEYLRVAEFDFEQVCLRCGVYATVLLLSIQTPLNFLGYLLRGETEYVSQAIIKVEDSPVNAH